MIRKNATEVGRKDVLMFLLDHPRRCFVYLFPSKQTWILFSILLIFTIIDWVAFLLLDIGNPAVEAIPIGTVEESCADCYNLYLSERQDFLSFL
ncbi:hypothetical protein BY996DRAFT_361470 [Phakopsora pachyrhizi]|nr:hypothetical protein BY996DRAFT_361470 [Phakopsora pachyrhizi]